MKPLSLVLPCYNEGKSLPGLVGRVLERARSRNLTPKEFKLILVENGSKDDSAQVMAGLKAAPGGEFLEIVPVSPNRGYGYGIFQGLKAAAPGIVSWSHADEQCDPEDAFKGWEMIRGGDGKTLIKGTRHGRAAQERFISKVFEILAALILWRPFHEINAQPKVFDSSLLQRITNPPDDFAFDIYVLIKAREAGIRISEIDVQFPPRKHGQSNWSATFRSKFRTIRRMLQYMAAYRLGRK